MVDFSATGSGTMPDAGDSDEEPPPRLVLALAHEDGDWSAIEPLAPMLDRLAAEFTHSVRPARASSAVVALSSDAHVRRLNEAFRGKATATNVLSFPARANSPPGSAGPNFLGDIVLAKETVLREARENGVPPRHHVVHLVVHGLLHLLGYDHETEPQATDMEALEASVLARLGIADPYANPAGTSPA